MKSTREEVEIMETTSEEGTRGEVETTMWRVLEEFVRAHYVGSGATGQQRESPAVDGSWLDRGATTGEDSWAYQIGRAVVAYQAREQFARLSQPDYPTLPLNREEGDALKLDHGLGYLVALIRSRCAVPISICRHIPDLRSLLQESWRWTILDHSYSAITPNFATVSLRESWRASTALASILGAVRAVTLSNRVQHFLEKFPQGDTI